MGQQRTIRGVTVALAAVAAMGLAGCASLAGGVNTSADSGTPAGGGATTSSTAAAAHIGAPITIKGNEDGSKIQVTAVKIVARGVKATDGFSTPDAGNRYVAIRFQIKNTGTVAYDDAPSNGAKVIDTEGQQFDADIFSGNTNVGVSLPASTKVAPGGVALGFIVFQVPSSSTITKVQFSQDSGFADTAEWVI